MKIRTHKTATYDENTTYPKAVWDPAAGKRLRVFDVILFLANFDTNKVAVKLLLGDDILCGVGCINKGYITFGHSFKGEIRGATNKKIRVDKTGTSSNFRIDVTVVGKEE